MTKQRLHLYAPCGTNFNIFLLHLEEHQKYGNLTLQPLNKVVYALQFTSYGFQPLSCHKTHDRDPYHIETRAKQINGPVSI